MPTGAPGSWFRWPRLLFLLSLCAFGLAFATSEWSGHRWRIVKAVAFSPDATTLGVGLYNGVSVNIDFKWCEKDSAETVALFEAKSGSGPIILDQLLHLDIGPHTDTVRQFFRFSPDGYTLAVGNLDGTVKLWDWKTKRLLDTRSAGLRPIAAVTYSNDGQKLAAASHHVFAVWEGKPKQECKRFESHCTGISDLAFTPDDALLITADCWQQGVECYDLMHSDPEQPIYPLMAIAGGEDGAFALRYSPDRQSLAIGGYKSVAVWDVKARKTRFTISEEEAVAVAFSPDGQTLATAGYKRPKFWDTETGRPKGDFLPAYEVCCLDYSPDGRCLATGNLKGEVIVWDLAARTQIWSYRFDGHWRWGSLPFVSAIIGAGLLLVAAGVSLMSEGNSFSLEGNCSGSRTR
jgi:WD40 repeat protein